MKKAPTSFLKIVILFIATGTLAGMIWFPQTEGRAANLDQVSIYLRDPFIIYIYIASTPFFIGLYQAFKLLNFIDANKVFSRGAINTLKTIKFAFLSLIGFIALALFYIRFFVHGDNPAGPTMLGIIFSFVFLIIASTAAVFEKLLQNEVNLKSKK